MTGSLCYIAEIITALSINYISIKLKKTPLKSKGLAVVGRRYSLRPPTFFPVSPGYQGSGKSELHIK